MQICILMAGPLAGLPRQRRPVTGFQKNLSPIRFDSALQRVLEQCACSSPHPLGLLARHAGPIV
jgi:hypothetical protein